MHEIKLNTYFRFMYSTQPSYWEKSIFLDNVDIAIIGAGLVGVSAAIYAKRKYPKSRIVVFDRAFIGSGASTKNAGFACIGSVSELLDDLEHSSESDVFKLVGDRYEGLIHLLELVGKNEVDYTPCGGFEIFRSREAELAENCEARCLYLNKILNSITGLDETFTLTPNKIRQSKLQDIMTCITNHAEGKLNPGKMMRKLYNIAQSAGIQFFNGIEVSKIEESTDSVALELANGWVAKASKLIIANNGFVKKLIPNLEIKAVRNQVLVTSKVNNLKIEGTFHMHKGYFYFRNIDSRILIGGGRHLDLEGETTNSFGSNTIVKDALMALLKEVVLPNENFSIENQWSGILGVGSSKQPILEKYSGRITLAVRLGGMGVALGSLLGKKAVAHI